MATRIDPLRVRAAPGHERAAERLARRLGVPYGPGPSRATLVVCDAGLVAADGDAEADALADPASADVGAARRAVVGLRVAFDLGRPGVEPLVRAVRPAVGADGRVVDATAGLGADAAALWRAGLRVTMLERDPVLAALLEDGLRRLREADPPGCERLTLEVGDARDRLTSLPWRPDVVVLDPMYPRSRGGAKRRGAAWLRAWLGEPGEEDDEAARELLQVARGVARRRVVVKRPLRGPELAPGVSGALRGTTTRFDLYAPG
jgi:16S rRNA (guanine1516-N2)-methyltransferase